MLDVDDELSRRPKRIDVGILVSDCTRGCVSRPAGRAPLWRLEAFTSKSQPDWEAFLGGLEGAPARRGRIYVCILNSECPRGCVRGSRPTRLVGRACRPRAANHPRLTRTPYLLGNAAYDQYGMGGYRRSFHLSMRSAASLTVVESAATTETVTSTSEHSRDETSWKTRRRYRGMAGTARRSRDKDLAGEAVTDRQSPDRRELTFNQLAHRLVEDNGALRGTTVATGWQRRPVRA